MRGLSETDLNLYYQGGSRKLGVNALKSTMDLLRVHAEEGLLEVYDVGHALMLQVCVADDPPLSLIGTPMAPPPPFAH